MKYKYLIRLDDACPYMDRAKWQRMEAILDKYGVKPLVGIIPANADPETIINPEDAGFWEKALRWEVKGWSIAVHGFYHVCRTDYGGLNPVHKRSEFAGLSYEEQAKKIKDGYEILMSHHIEPEYFFAPSHTYDENTLLAIVNNTEIKYVSDTIALRPYRYNYKLKIVPCQMGRLRKMPIPGYWTACYHPNIMDDRQFEMLESFLKEHAREIVSFKDLSLGNVGTKSMVDRLLSFVYFTMRRIKG